MSLTKSPTLALLLRLSLWALLAEALHANLVWGGRNVSEIIQVPAWNSLAPMQLKGAPAQPEHSPKTQTSYCLFCQLLAAVTT